MKFKYQGGITKKITSFFARQNRKLFSKNLDVIIKSVLNSSVSTKIDIDLVGFSSKNDFDEQIFSILSFIRYVGIPLKWTIFSDGSHTENQINTLKQYFKFVHIQFIDWGDYRALPANSKVELYNYDAPILDYASKFPLGKRLFYYLNYNIVRPTFFLDSDVLFYYKFPLDVLLSKSPFTGFYLPELSWGCLDSRYKDKINEELYQVNAGFFVLKENIFDFNIGLNFLNSLNYEYEYFSEQTIMHIILNKMQCMPLDPRRFILNTGDQFDFSYLYHPKDIAIRHYTGPVRHKMWQKSYKWHLSID